MDIIDNKNTSTFDDKVNKLIQVNILIVKKIERFFFEKREKIRCGNIVVFPKKKIFPRFADLRKGRKKFGKLPICRKY